MPHLLKLIEEGKIRTDDIITHVAPLESGPELYKTFRDKQDGCVKVVLKPGMMATKKISIQEQVNA
jgi:threonine dehydrogenase-like Zn-dependent dehydrogenase